MYVFPRQNLPVLRPQPRATVSPPHITPGEEHILPNVCRAVTAQDLAEMWNLPGSLSSKR